jgi:hypothetical protein
MNSSSHALDIYKTQVNSNILWGFQRLCCNEDDNDNRKYQTQCTHWLPWLNPPYYGPDITLRNKRILGEKSWRKHPENCVPTSLAHPWTTLVETDSIQLRKSKRLTLKLEQLPKFAIQTHPHHTFQEVPVLKQEVTLSLEVILLPQFPLSFKL